MRHATVSSSHAHQSAFSKGRERGFAPGLAGGFFSSAVVAHSGRTLRAAGAGCLTAVNFSKGLLRHDCSLFRSPAKSTANACEEKNHIRKPSERTTLWKV